LIKTQFEEIQSVGNRYFLNLKTAFSLTSTDEMDGKVQNGWRWGRGSG
jgi:hypothetical protein